jgi:hypothetical protein
MSIPKSRIREIRADNGHEFQAKGMGISKISQSAMPKSSAAPRSSMAKWSDRIDHLINGNFANC